MPGPQSWDAYESLRIPMICPDCQEDPPHLTNDLSMGDVVCTSCGRVIADHLLDESAEWRNFANDNDGPGEDKSRVGQAASELLYGSQLQTSIASTGGNSIGSHSIATPPFGGSLARAHADTSLEKANAYLIAVYAKIDTLCSSVSVTRAVSDYAKQAYKRGLDKDIWKPIANVKTPRAQQTQMAQIATCLVLACRHEGVSRSMKEITQLVGVDRKQFTKVFKEYQKGVAKHSFQDTGEHNSQGSGTSISSVKAETAQPLVSATKADTTRVEELIPRFASRLSPPLPFAVSRKAQDYAVEVANRGLATGRQPASVAGACLHLATRDMMDAPSRKEIASVAGMSEGTVKKVSNILEPHFKQGDTAVMDGYAGLKQGTIE